MIQFAENDVVTYLKQAKEHIATLRQGGCAVSITNFGCTLNPLNTLKHVEIDYIKLYSDHQTLFDAADYAFISPNPNIHSKPFQTDEEKSSQQLAAHLSRSKNHETTIFIA